MTTRAPDRPVRVHHETLDGRPACLYKANGRTMNTRQPSSTPGIEDLHFCGPCLLVLMFLKAHDERLWAGVCKPPDLTPMESLGLLAETPWGGLFATDALADSNVWWFERKVMTA